MGCPSSDSMAITLHRATQVVLTIGLVVGGGATCFAQSDSPPTMPDRAQEVGPPTDERFTPERSVPRERLAERPIVRERVVERRQEGEIYVDGFGGFTWGYEFDSAEGTGSLKGLTSGSLDLANSVTYGAKVGYFHPGRLNRLGLEIEGFNSTPHIKQSLGLPGSHLRVTTLVLNVIAHTKPGCGSQGDRDRDVRDDLHRSAWSATRPAGIIPRGVGSWRWLRGLRIEA